MNGATEEVQNGMEQQHRYCEIVQPKVDGGTEQGHNGIYQQCRYGELKEQPRSIELVRAEQGHN